MSESSSDFVVITGEQDGDIMSKSVNVTPIPSPRIHEASVEEVILEKSISAPVLLRRDVLSVSSVMPSTMAIADHIVESSTPLIRDVAEVGTSVTAGAIAGKVLYKPTEDNITNASAVGSVFGKTVGEAITRFMAWFFPIVARHCGAHQCDHCGAKDLYNYYEMASGQDLDLCPECYEICGKGIDQKLDQAFTKKDLILHDNTLFTLKMFLGAVFVAIVVKQILVLLFGHL